MRGSGDALRARSLVEALRPDLLKVFKPAFLGRLIAVPYYPITDDAMRKIIELQLGRIRPGCKKTIAPSSPMTTPWSPPSPSAVPR